MNKVIVLAAALSLSVSSLAFAQTQDNSTNGSTNATSGNNAMGSTMGNAPMANNPGAASPATGAAMGTGGSTTMGSMGSPATTGPAMGSAAMMPPAAPHMNNGMASSTSSQGSMTGAAPTMGGNSQTTNTQATIIPQPGSGATVPTMSGKAAGNQPLKGSNSFTEKQAERRLTKQGYTNVAGLAKDNAGVWRGTATNKSSQSVSVALDYKGRITETR